MSNPGPKAQPEVVNSQFITTPAPKTLFSAYSPTHPLPFQSSMPKTTVIPSENKPHTSQIETKEASTSLKDIKNDASVHAKSTQLLKHELNKKMLRKLGTPVPTPPAASTPTSRETLIEIADSFCKVNERLLEHIRMLSIKIEDLEAENKELKNAALEEKSESAVELEDAKRKKRKTRR